MRIENWDEKLMDVITFHQAQAFAWGVSDCAVLFDDAVKALTGEKPLAPFHRWKTERGALRALAVSGVATVPEWIAQNFDEIVPADARRGDVGYAAATDKLSFPAIIVGAVAMSRDEASWIVLPRSHLVRCFRVG